MANDDETLTFRLRAIAENMDAFGKAARGADNVNASMIKSRKVAEDLAVTNRKLTAARDKEADAAGRVRTAETKLNEVRANTNSKMPQIAAAEERLATARRNSARASSDANRIEQDFKKTAERALSKVAGDAGETAGHRFNIGFGKVIRNGSIDNDAKKSSSRISRWFGIGGDAAGHRFHFGFGKAIKAIEGDAVKTGTHVGRFFGSGILSGLEGLLRSQAGGVVAAALIAVVAVFAPAIGAVLAGGIVFAFGAGLATLGIIFAAKSKVVRDKWKITVAAMGQDMKGIAKPFEAVLIHLADSMRTTIGRLAPTLRAAFAISASPIQGFLDNVLKALERLKPALLPLSRAFGALLDSLGPALQDAFGKIADGLIRISNSISKNPAALGDFVRGLGNIINTLFRIIAVLNDADGAFKRLTGVSLVTVAMRALEGTIVLLLSPIIVLTKAVEILATVFGAMFHAFDRPKSIGGWMHDRAKEGSELSKALQKAADDFEHAAEVDAAAAHKSAVAHAAHAATLNHANHVTNEANTAARNLAAAFDRQSAATQHSIDLLNRQADLLLGLAGGEIDYAQAVRDANDAIKENGRTHNLATQAGINNQRALMAVASAAKTARDGFLKVTGGTVQAAAAARQGQTDFVKLAVKMGYTLPVAQQMARDFIKIPNVTRTATLLANKKDLDAKLVSVNKQLNDPNLTKPRRAQLEANKKDLEIKIAEALSALKDPKLVQARIAQIQANKKDLEKKLAATLTELANPNLTKARIAQLQANKKDLEKKIADAKKQLADPLLIKPRVAKLEADKRVQEKKLADAKRQLADPNLTKTRTAKLDADKRAAERKIRELQAQIDALHGKVVAVKYFVSGSLGLGPRAYDATGRANRATGGHIKGPGSGTSDKAGLFALSNNEWVIRAKSSQKYGDYAMKSVNEGTATVIPNGGMARGGPARGRGRPPALIKVNTQGPFASLAQAYKAFDGMMLSASSAPGIGKGVARWRGVALAALAAARAPASWIGSLLRRMNQESGGNPRAINLTDINARRGIPSKGLMQVIDPTFNAFANGYRSRGVWDPFANIFASIKYANARYGAAPIGWNRRGGYKNGGWLMPGQTAFNETRKPEAVFNQQQLAAMNRRAAAGPIELDRASIKALASELAREIASNPPQVYFDGDRVDAHFSSKAVGRGY